MLRVRELRNDDAARPHHVPVVRHVLAASRRATLCSAAAALSSSALSTAAVASSAIASTAISTAISATIATATSRVASPA